MISQPPSQHHFQMTPFYAPASDEKTQYNTESYYNNYGFSPSQAPPHPEFPTAWNNHLPQQQYQPQPQQQVPAFASPPPPTWQQVQQEFGTVTSVNSNVQTVDFFDTTAPLQPSPPRESRAVSLDTAFDKEMLEIIASQERALEQAKQRGSSGSSGSNTAMTSYGPTDQLISVPTSHNPTGSDAVHPHRMQWKQNRGGKTAAGATGGAIIGGIVMAPVFPIGMAIGGAVGGYAANKISKHGERRAQREWEQSSVQQGAQRSLAAKYQGSVV